ncbi:MAG TPA: trypsin-like peptidase domain-containing protein [Pseudonocardia sp.]
MAERQDVSGPGQTIQPGQMTRRRTKHRRGPAAAVGAVAVLATATVGGIVLGPSSFTAVTIAGRASPATPAIAAPATQTSGASAAKAKPGATASGRPAAAVPTRAAGTSGKATNVEEVGVVDITTLLDYGQGAAAGTGVVLTSNGEILTNNHVVEGATRIRVTVPATRASYTASVVGTDPSDDIAVLRVPGAAGLATAHLATESQAGQVGVGDAVTAVGNAGGAGGTPTAAGGTVVALGRDITASDETGADAERLTGLIEVNASVQPGDSGGPLYSHGVVIGIDTAASASDRGGFDTTAAGGRSVGFAIPITRAISIADRIVAGEDSTTIHQGQPAFLGVQMTAARGRVGEPTISGVVAGSPAAAAGLRAGDTITAIDSTAIDDTAALTEALANHHPRDRIAVSWTDNAGGPHTATVTLTTGPAD